MVAVVLWVLPGGLALVYGASSPTVQAYNAKMPEATAVLIAVTLLFLLPVNWHQREFTLAAICIAIVVSETASNTASANMVIPVMISLANAAGVTPLPPAIGATLGASWGCMLPVSTPPNAIVYGSGMLPITAMMKVGLLFDRAGALL
jgi:sodium-dependent dicarboxylate transporter 2/3/5